MDDEINDLIDQLNDIELIQFPQQKNIPSLETRKHQNEPVSDEFNALSHAVIDLFYRPKQLNEEEFSRLIERLKYYGEMTAWLEINNKNGINDIFCKLYSSQAAYVEDENSFLKSADYIDYFFEIFSKQLEFSQINADYYRPLVYLFNSYLSLFLTNQIDPAADYIENKIIGGAKKLLFHIKQLPGQADEILSPDLVNQTKNRIAILYHLFAGQLTSASRIDKALDFYQEAVSLYEEFVSRNNLKYLPAYYQANIDLFFCYCNHVINNLFSDKESMNVGSQCLTICEKLLKSLAESDENDEKYASRLDNARHLWEVLLSFVEVENDENNNGLHSQNEMNEKNNHEIEEELEPEDHTDTEQKISKKRRASGFFQSTSKKNKSDPDVRDPDQHPPFSP